MNSALILRASRIGLIVMGLLLILSCLPGLARAEIRFPALSGRVVDEAQLLSPSQEAALTSKLAALEQQTGDQLVIVTLPSLQDQDIADFGYQLGRHWGIGQKENDGGALLIVAPNERKVRIEVGYGLEGVLTDAYSAMIIQRQILPAFRDGDFAGGIARGTDAIIGQLTVDPAEAAARADEALQVAEKPQMPILPGIIVTFVLLLIFMRILGAAMGGGRRHRGKGADGLSPILIWAASEAMKNRNSRGGDGWGGGGGGFGGGGFGGGGGGFGGGGASGGW